MWASAVYNFGLTSKAFWALTPRQYDALAVCRKREQRYQDAHQARIVASIINYSMRAPEKPVLVEDLMPSDQPKRKPRGPSKRMLALFEQERIRLTMLIQNAKASAQRR